MIIQACSDDLLKFDQNVDALPLIEIFGDKNLQEFDKGAGQKPGSSSSGRFVTESTSPHNFVKSPVEINLQR